MDTLAQRFSFGGPRRPGESLHRPLRANFTPLRFCRYFTDNDPWVIATRIGYSNVKVAVCFNFHGGDAVRQGEPLKFGIDNERPKPRNSPNQDLEPAETLFCLGEHPPLSDLQPAPLTARQEENFYEQSASNHQFNLLN